LISNKHPPPSPESNDRDADKDNRGKRYNKNKDSQLTDRELGNAVNNTNPVKEWLVTKNYRKIFHKGVNKSHLQGQTCQKIIASIVQSKVV
jgi:hypothetical protein